MATLQITRLLVVDDEVALMQALCNILQQQGYDAVGCAGAQEALNCLRGERFQLMLTDLMMPGTDGIALARAALALDPHMAVVMMTGQGTVETAVEAMQSGVLDYVLKPFKLGTMLPVLERALSVHRLRAENAELQARVVERTRELEIANRELEAYAATVSHDLRAPLRGIDGLTQLLSSHFSDPPSNDTKQLLELISSRVRRAQRLVADLLRLSRGGRQPLARQRIDVGQLVRDVAEELIGEPRSADLTLDVALGMPEAVADPGLLRQVFVNLIGNALKFTQRVENARIEIGYDESAVDTPWYVQDNGPGFDATNAERLFMPFERLRGAEKFEGSGVGLSIARRVIERHGGRILARSSIGNGARFEFSLPQPSRDSSFVAL